MMNRSDRIVGLPGLCAGALACVAAGGCSGASPIENQFREDGPSASMELRTPTAIDVYEHHQPAAERRRDWQSSKVALADGRVAHFPLHFEDPFEDEQVAFFANMGMERKEYRIDWEDVAAAPWSYARHWVNLVFYPVSLVVAPPWTLMESDGVQNGHSTVLLDGDAHRAELSEVLPIPPGMRSSE